MLCFHGVYIFLRIFLLFERVKLSKKHTINYKIICLLYEWT